MIVEINLICCIFYFCIFNIKSYNMDFISALDECDHRNALLVAKHGSIPSYALWRDTDIENQTIDERISWWEESEKNPGQQSILQSLRNMKENNIKEKNKSIKNRVIKPIDISINSDMKQVTSDKNNFTETKESSKVINAEEFCSKRYGNELYCDI